MPPAECKSNQKVECRRVCVLVTHASDLADDYCRKDRAFRFGANCLHGSDVEARRFHGVGDRVDIRRRAARAALEMVRRSLSND